MLPPTLKMKALTEKYLLKQLARTLVLPGQADGLAVEVRPFRGELER